jgi:UDP-N-acetylmuramoylalanine--D-glutamate ligase
MRSSPDVAVVTNLRPNHLDVHRDMQEYADAKRNILPIKTPFPAAFVVRLPSTAAFSSVSGEKRYGFRA